MSLAQRLALDDAAVRDSSSPILAPGFALRTESEHSGVFGALQEYLFHHLFVFEISRND